MKDRKNQILVVDDEPEMQRLVRQRFRKKIKAGDLNFQFAQNGVEALKILEKSQDIDMVLADIRMPEMDGLTLLSKLAKLETPLKTVVVSAYGDMQNIRTAMNRGAFDFLVKPIDFKDLEITIDKTLAVVGQLRSQQQQLQRKQAQLQQLNQELETKVEERTAALQERETRYRALMDGAGDAIVVTDRHGNLLEVNQKAEELLGYSGAELTSMHFTQLHRPEDIPNITVAFEQILDQQFSCLLDVNFLRRDGRAVPVDISAAAIGVGGETIVQEILRDISDRKQAERELIEAKEVAETAAAAKSSFLAQMSHEIRTPMNGVIGMLILLQSSELTAEQRSQVSIAQSSAESLLTLINDILDFSKVDAGKLELEIVDFDLHQQLGDLAKSMALTAQEKAIELVLDLRGIEQSMAKGDPGRLRQILTNLVGNAIKFTEQGEILIRGSLEAASDGLIFTGSVSDTGIGIPPEKLANLFDPFIQVDASTTRKYGGTGLGLSIVQKLCELMEGSIRVQSKLGQGSCFEFTVRMQHSSQPQPVSPPLNLQGLTLLVVDDNATNREVLCGQLQQWGATVVEAEDCTTALALCTSQASQPPPPTEQPCFDLALVNMNMSDMDGIELGRRIHGVAGLQDLPLVMMAAMGDPCHVKQLAVLGRYVCLTKPIAQADLVEALALAQDRGASHTSPGTLLVAQQQNSSSSRQERWQELETLPQWPDQTCVLLVEDNPVNQLVAKAFLQQLGLMVALAANGREALQMLRQSPEERPYTLVLMDCQMPEMDGYEASRQIRAGKARDRNREIVIVAMTANAMKGDKEKCLEAGMNDYLTKPIDPQAFLTTLKQWLIDRRETREIQEITAKVKETRRSTVSIFNHADLVARLDGNEELAVQICYCCLDDIPREIQKLKLALKSEDSQRTECHAHGLKGAAANLGGEALRQVAADMEQAARAGDLNLASTYMVELERQHTVLRDAAESWLQGLPTE